MKTLTQIFSTSNLKSMNKEQLLKVIDKSKDKDEVEFAKNELLIRYWNN